MLIYDGNPNMHRYLIRSLLMWMCAATTAAAQTLPTSLPTVPPNSAPRREAILPTGFTRVQIEGRDFFLEPRDEAWVRAAMETATPTTMPTTMPSDIIEQLRAKRGTITQRMARDLAVTDTKPIDDYLDQRLKVFLQGMDEYRPPIIYLIVTVPRLREIMMAGWTDPRFYYNRAANDVSYSTRVNLAMDERGDTVVALLYDPQVAADARQQRIMQEIRTTEAGILNAVSREALAMSTVALVELVSAQLTSGLTLKPDQEWFGVGASGVLAGQYVAELSGISSEQILDGLSQENPGNPIRPSTIDLLHPMSLGDLRPQATGAYLDAYRRRAMQVVRSLAAKGGEGAIAKVLAAMRQNPPADGPALVRLIQQATGVDLSKELANQ